MPLVPLSYGTEIDRPQISAEPFISSGINIRVRATVVESLGLFGPLRDYQAQIPDIFGEQIQLQSDDVFRKIFTSPAIIQGQILAGSVSTVTLMQFDPASTIDSGTRWETFDLTPVGGFSSVTDSISRPSSGRVEIPHVWWFADQDDLIVGQRADVPTDVPYIWDRESTSKLEPIVASRHPNDPLWPTPPDEGAAPDPPVTPVPRGAVGGGVLNRILVLLGASSFTDPDPQRFMTIRWSDRFDYGQFTPTDITISGELTLEGGSRIVGGGVTGYGVIAWTDKRMALLTETFDPNSVFDRKYIDGSRGLMANNAWCEADGSVYWLDETRSLNRFDGGRPVQIINGNKYGSIERLEDAQLARVYLTPNQEFGEVIVHYPSGDDTEVDAQIVYNYLYDCWYPWNLSRSAWNPRFGMIPNTAIDTDGYVYVHDLDVGLPDTSTPIGMDAVDSKVSVEDVFPMSFSLRSNLITQPNPSYTSWKSTKVTIDYLTAPAKGAADSFNVKMEGYREPSLLDVQSSDEQTFSDDVKMRDYRVGGKAIRFSIDAVDVRTVYRFGMIEVAGDLDAKR